MKEVISLYPPKRIPKKKKGCLLSLISAAKSGTEIAGCIQKKIYFLGFIVDDMPSNFQLGCKREQFSHLTLITFK